MSTNLRNLDAADFTFRTPNSPERNLHLLYLSHSVWSVRNAYRHQRTSSVLPATLVADSFLSLARNKTAPPRKNRTKERQAFQRTLEALPDGIHVYTDGSSFGGGDDPRSAGAGVYLNQALLLSYQNTQVNRQTIMPSYLPYSEPWNYWLVNRRPPYISQSEFSSITSTQSTAANAYGMPNQT
jgi:hypothetical protein